MSNPVSPILAELKVLAEKAMAQGVAFASYYAVVVHTDFTKIETAAGAAITAGVGYILNRLRNLKV